MYIYCATSPSGKHYIGQTRRCVSIRWQEHVHDAHDSSKNRCKALNNAIRKYGGNMFEVSIVMCCLPWLLDEYEAHCISHFDSVVPNGYNIKLGGSSGAHSNDTKMKIRAKLLGKTFSLTTLKLRGNSKKRDKDLPMFVIGWYKGGELKGFRVCNHPQLPERRFTLARYGNNAKSAALEYISQQDGMQFND